MSDAKCRVIHGGTTRRFVLVVPDNDVADVKGILKKSKSDTLVLKSAGGRKRYRAVVEKTVYDPKIGHYFSGELSEA